MASSLVRAHILVHGCVQGVFYRAFTAFKARALGLCGWVRNLPNGDVEIVVEGEKAKIKELLEELWRGPPAAKVSDIEVKYLSFKGDFRTFTILR